MTAVGRCRRRGGIGSVPVATLVAATMGTGGGGVNRRRPMATSRAFAAVSAVSMRFHGFRGQRELGRRRLLRRLLRLFRALEYSEKTSAGADLTPYCVHSQKTTQKNYLIFALTCLPL
ncbi:uncharacterized protein LOC144583137 [Pogona vitticeps]